MSGLSQSAAPVTYRTMGRIKDTPGQSTAKFAAAEKRRCPACKRKSALSRVWSDYANAGAGGTVTFCRWCGWERGQPAAPAEGEGR
jgi:hypothetical protein